MKHPIQEKFNKYGFVILAPGQVPSDAITTFSDEWKEVYFRNEFHKIDPVFEFAVRSTRNSNCTLLSEAQMTNELFEEARMFEADSNFVSVSHYGGNTMVFGGVNPELDPRATASIQHACQATHRIELLKNLDLLTDTQIDLMEMAEEGFLDKEIASEFGISLSAIAQRKQAICKAVGTDCFKSTLRLYTLQKWGGLVGEYT